MYVVVHDCRNIRVKTPFPIVRDADNLHFTYLDTVGRPVITMKKNNLVEQHIQDFEVICLINKTTSIPSHVV